MPSTRLGSAVKEAALRSATYLFAYTGLILSLLAVVLGPLIPAPKSSNALDRHKTRSRRRKRVRKEKREEQPLPPVAEAPLAPHPSPETVSERLSTSDSSLFASTLSDSPESCAAPLPPIDISPSRNACETQRPIAAAHRHRDADSIPRHIVAPSHLPAPDADISDDIPLDISNLPPTVSIVDKPAADSAPSQPRLSRRGHASHRSMTMPLTGPVAEQNHDASSPSLLCGCKECKGRTHKNFCPRRALERKLRRSTSSPAGELSKKSSKATMRSRSRPPPLPITPPAPPSASSPPLRTNPYDAPYYFPLPGSPETEDYVRQARAQMQGGPRPQSAGGPRPVSGNGTRMPSGDRGRALPNDEEPSPASPTQVPDTPSTGSSGKSASRSRFRLRGRRSTGDAAFDASI